MFRADVGAGADEGTRPDAVFVVKRAKALFVALVAVVQVVALGEGYRRRAEEVGIDADLRAGLVAEHAVDAHGVLLEFRQLLRSLQVLFFGKRARVFGDDEGADGVQFVDERVKVNDQVFFNRELVQRADSDFANVGKFTDEGGAGKARLAVYHHAAGAADFHATRPAVGDGRVKVAFEKVKGIEDGHVLCPFDFKGLRPGFFVLVGTVTHQVNSDFIAHDGLPLSGLPFLLLRRTPVSPVAIW